MLAFELVGVFVISTSILNLQVYSVMKMSDAIIFLHKNNKKKFQKNSHVLWIANMLFFNLGRGIGTCSGKSWSMNLTFKHTSNRSGCTSWFSTQKLHFSWGFVGKKGARDTLKFLGNVIFTIKQIISRKWTLSMKGLTELPRGFFFGWKLSAGAWSDPCSDQDKSCAHYWAHLGDFLHDKHLSLSLK